MKIVAKAPGKLVVLGEYAVLDGGDALVMAVDRCCRATLETSTGDDCYLETLAAAPRRSSFSAGSASGAALVDCVTRMWPEADTRPWHGRLDSRPLHRDARKLGLGSSAAALVAWAGAWCAYAHRTRLARDARSVAELIALHRVSQGAAGSGLDVAASLLGGVVWFRSGSGAAPECSSVDLPEGVGFTAVTTPRPASTAQLLRLYCAWRDSGSADAAARLADMRGVAGAGAAAARAGDAGRFVEAVGRYGELLRGLGESIGAAIVTSEHAELARLAKRHGITYKVSGAGGGDVGIAVATDHDALAAFAGNLPPGCEALSLGVDREGLVIEEQAV